MGWRKHRPVGLLISSQHKNLNWSISLTDSLAVAHGQCNSYQKPFAVAQIIIDLIKFDPIIRQSIVTNEINYLLYRTIVNAYEL